MTSFKIGELYVNSDWKVKYLGIFVSKKNGSIWLKGFGNDDSHRTGLGGSGRIMAISPEQIDALVELLEKAKLVGLELKHSEESDWQKKQRAEVPWVGKEESEADKILATAEEVITEDE